MIGFCIMGNFNILSAHEVSSLCDRLGFQITAFSSLVMAMGNLFVGVVQFIIGNFASDGTYVRYFRFQFGVFYFLCDDNCAYCA